MRKVYEPNKAEGKLKEALTQLYLMKPALGIENHDLLEKRIDKIRAILLEVEELIF